MRSEVDWFATWWEQTYIQSTYLLLLTGIFWMMMARNAAPLATEHPIRAVVEHSLNFSEILPTSQLAELKSVPNHGEVTPHEDSVAVEQLEIFLIIFLSTLAVLVNQLIYRIVNYNNMAQKIKSIHAYVTDISRVCEMDGYMIFCQASQRIRPSTRVHTLAFVCQVLRMLIVTGLSATIFIALSVSGRDPCLTVLVKSIILILTLVQVPCCGVSAFWFFYRRSLHFSRLMSRYATFLSQVDVARGRSVPVPPRHKHLHPLLPPRNPYTSSRDVRLLLDMLATLQGPGAALRVLAVMEPDVAESWQVVGATVECTADSVTVYWKDPLVLGYMPPASLCVSYGVELEVPGDRTLTSVLTQEEIIYMKQTWTKDNPEKIHFNSSQDIVYHHEFDGVPVHGLLRLRGKVRVWTVVHGQLIVCASVSPHTDMVPKQDTKEIRAEAARVNPDYCTVDLVQEPPKKEKNSQSHVFSDKPVHEELVSDKPVQDETIKKDPFLDVNEKPNNPKQSKRIYSKKSSSESNLTAGDGQFDRQSGKRQSMPQAFVNYGMSLESEEDESHLDI